MIKLDYPEFTIKEEQVRALALTLAIESIVGFEQPRNDSAFRYAHSGKEFVARAKVFEQYIKNGLTEDTTPDNS